MDGEHYKRLEENSVTSKKLSHLKKKMEKLTQKKSEKIYKSSSKSSRLSEEFAAQPKKSGRPLKLPSISLQTEKEPLKSQSKFSQVPILPSIASQHFEETLKGLEGLNFGTENSSSNGFESTRPKTCPGSFIGTKFYNDLKKVYRNHSVGTIQSHFRSYDRPHLASRVRHEWGGGNHVHPFNIPPKINKVKDILNFATDFSDNTSKYSNSFVAPVPGSNTILCQKSLPSPFKYQPSLKNKSTSVTIRNNLCTPNEGSSFESQNVSSFRKNPLNTTSIKSKVYSEVSNPSNLAISAKCNDISSTINIKVKSKRLEPLLYNEENLCDKRKTLRCTKCKKRLSITNTFECRCGLFFCSYHRYSESHRCTFDFKSESRKVLQEANPSVVAPKLPKI